MTSGRRRVVAPAFDALCVLALVVIGTRNHDTDTGIGGVLFVGAPFWIAMIGSRVVPVVRRAPTSAPAGALAWVGTVTGGMILRHYVFDRGTALAFVIVATLFLGATMLGWRAIARRTRRG